MSAGDKFFIDTNVFLYQMSGREPEKRASAETWIDAVWRSECGRLSWQVIYEVYSNAVGKFQIQPAQARFFVKHLMEWEPVAPGSRSIERAWHWCDKAELHFWDAMILAAAEQCECAWLVSEDLQGGRKYGSVTVINPFRRDPAEFGLTGHTQ